MPTYLAYTRSGTEFATEEALEDLGLTVWCGRAVQSHYNRKTQEYRVEVNPALPNYLFICMTDAEYHALQDMPGRPKGLAPHLTQLTDGDMRDVERFQAMVDFNEGAAWDRIHRNERPEIDFKPGDALESGQFEGLALRFEDVVRDNGAWKIKVEAEMMGRAVSMTLDPDDVRKAG